MTTNRMQECAVGRTARDRGE